MVTPKVIWPTTIKLNWQKQKSPTSKVTTFRSAPHSQASTVHVNTFISTALDSIIDQAMHQAIVNSLECQGAQLKG